jgi:hypothetical protein
MIAHSSDATVLFPDSVISTVYADEDDDVEQQDYLLAEDYDGRTPVRFLVCSSRAMNCCSFHKCSSIEL